MDPLTVIVRIAAKHGISKLINALTGLRTLLDAGTTTDAQVRADELVRATALFREASAAARSTLQVAVAERYLVLCAIARGRRDAARTALGRLVARRRLGRTRAGPDPPAPLAGERTTQLVVPIQRAATEAGELSVQLLRESAVLARGLGVAAASPPELRWPREPVLGAGGWHLDARPDPLVHLIEVDFTIRAEPPLPELLVFSLKGTDPRRALCCAPSVMAPAMVNGQSSIMVDFDEQLLQRLQAFQKANGLTTTGKVDPSTWHTLIHTKPILSDDGQYRWDGSAWHPTALTSTPAGLPQSKTVTGFGKDCAELKPEQKDALREVAAELAAHPLGHDGYVLVVGTATTADLAKRLAEAAGDFLRTLLKAEERVDVRTLVEPKGKPTVEVTIHRREWQHKPAPKLEMPTKKVPTIDLDKLGPPKPDITKPPPGWPPEDPEVSDGLIRVCIGKPVPKSILDELSVLRDKDLEPADTEKVASCIARAAHLPAAKETKLGDVLRKKLKEGGKGIIKNLIEKAIEVMVKEPVEKPLEPHGPSKLPEKPDGVFVLEFTFP